MGADETRDRGRADRRAFDGRESRPNHGSAGHTLVELLVTLALMAVAYAIPAASLTHCIARTEAATAARLCENGLAAAQVHAIWGASPAELIMADTGLRVYGDGVLSADAGSVGLADAPVANVSRWRVPDGVRVRFLPGFGSPDGSGSLFFGREGTGERVVLRLESGLTRRERW